MVLKVASYINLFLFSLLLVMTSTSTWNLFVIWIQNAFNVVLCLRQTCSGTIWTGEYCGTRISHYWNAASVFPCWQLWNCSREAEVNARYYNSYVPCILLITKICIVTNEFCYYCRAFAATIPRKHDLRYNPYTQSVEVLDNKNAVLKLASSIQSDAELVQKALKKVMWLCDIVCCIM